MKHSLKTELFLSILVLILVSFGGIYLANNFLLEPYYVRQKESKMIEVYEELNKYDSVEDYQSEEFEHYFQQLSDNNNLHIAIVMLDELGQMISVYESKNNKIMRGRLEGYYYGFASDDIYTEVIDSQKYYVMEKCTDFTAGNQFLECFGLFKNQCCFLMRSPLSSIKESAQISNQFMGYFLIIGLLVAILITWWMSEKIAKPVKELTKLSQRMANLEFDARYTGNVKNEIGQLGDNFNYLSNQLEHTISELKSANNELMNDLEEKTKIEEMRKEFLSNVTHELKTPIALIQGYAEGLEECVNEEDGSREFYCEVIMDEAAKMNHMVKMMLSLNHLESGQDMLSMERFDITQVIQGVLSSTKVLADQKGSDIICRNLDHPIYVWADEYKIEEVITNYVSNAIHYVEGDNRICVSATQNAKTVRIEVFNSGKQIPEEELDKIWVKFYKVDKARTREYGGSGIGLSIVKAIMDLHHQGFGVQNTEDGVIFWFELDCDDKGAVEYE